MKTPREILFARHENIAPKLDAVRRKVLNEFNNEETKEQSWSAAFVAWLLGCSKTFCRKLFWPNPKAWAALAAIWIFILALNFSMRDKTPVVAEKISPPSPEMIAELKQQQRMFAELMGANDLKIADRQKPFSPGPRSERAQILMT